MSIRDEELIEYLLGEADAALRNRVEQALKSDPAVATRLGELRSALGLLDGLSTPVQPPEDLLSRTMFRIDEAAQQDAFHDSAIEGSAVEGSAVEGSAGNDDINQEQLGQDSGREPGRDSGREPGNKSSRPSVRLRRTEPSHVGVRTGRTPWDSVMLTVSIVALTCLMLPLVLEARSKSRRLLCASNLKEMGRALTQLAQLDPEHRFPAVPIYGRENFAGIYSVKLQDHGLMESPARLRCPSLLDINAASSLYGSAGLSVPTTEMLNAASEDQLMIWRSELGGNYAFHFGSFDGSRIVGPRLEGRTHLALLADAPKIEGDRDLFTAHEGRGINVYHEDGHVAFFCFSRDMLTRRPGQSGSVVLVDGWQAADYPFRNHEGLQAHSLYIDDAVLGPSAAAPLPTRVADESYEPRTHQ